MSIEPSSLRVRAQLSGRQIVGACRSCVSSTGLDLLSRVLCMEHGALLLRLLEGQHRMGRTRVNA